ncbi:carboxylic ester hydrolase-36 [Coleophoma cylindrospora]|uniref:Carboxylic ester hydrolase n=1 Tax=Coleophoma cylindrospora TaxID=1849047 RepID=A0A3D8R703_9HELO|nr:carboxylic ester hydrolase-36 [Coleophoma cylindrospora]
MAALSDICTVSTIQAALPANDFIPGITFDASSVTAATVYNSSVSSNNYPDATIDYCNVTFAYSHAGLNDKVQVQYWLPATFSNRYLTTGGFGYAINSASSNLPEAIIYNAVGGATDGGFGGFDVQFDAVFPLTNGTANLPALYSFAYESLHELTVFGKEFARSVYGVTNGTKIYSYYHSCSEGGREGWSQVQRYGDQFDGVVVGAPAFRFSFQQLNHLYMNFVEQTLNYYPPSCELDAIINATIAACDPLDGKADGVVSRSDLCKLDFNLTSLIGTPYSCAASGGTTTVLKRQSMNSSSTPAQNGTITAEGINVVQTTLDGLHDTNGNALYFSYQPGADLSQDGATAYDSTTGEWGISISSFGTEFYQRFLQLVDADTLSSIEGYTYDTLRDWMIQGWYEYEDTLHTTNPDLTQFLNGGGKILHYHGEQDPSIPTASSVRYHESVRQIMYPGLSFNESTSKLAEWYKLYLVPGAAHCGPNSQEPNGPWCQTTLAVMIDWVENSNAPDTLNATYTAGDYIGQSAEICQWPLRPMWSNNGTTMNCEYDQRSLDSWFYDFTAGLKLPLY